MDPLKHYGFLFDSSSPRSSRSMAKGEERVEITRKIANLQLKWKKERSYHQKSSLPICTNLRPCAPRNKLCSSCFDLCMRSVLEHMHWSYVSHPILLQFVDQIDPVCYLHQWFCLWLDLVTNKLIHSSEDRIAFNFSMGFKLLPICIGRHNICITIKSKYELMFYTILELLIMWVSFQAIL